MKAIKKKWRGLILCLALAVPSHLLGQKFPVIGGPVFAIVAGMILTVFIKDKSKVAAGISYTSKKILQYAVILLGFGMNLKVVMQTGRQSLPIIFATILTSLLLAFVLHRLLSISNNISILIGVGSSICGGSAVAATAPVIEAREEEVAQAISVIFLFNVIAALLFPVLGTLLDFPTSSGQVFGIFAGTAVNDTSSVTAAASTWDSMFGLGTATLDKAVTVKLTRTLAIIPITLALAYLRTKQAKNQTSQKISLKNIFPFFILFFIGASLITTLGLEMGLSIKVFNPLKDLSKFFIIMAMGAIGLNTNIISLIKSGAKPILLGLACWISITGVTLLLLKAMAMF